MLSAGDIALIRMQSDNPDSFSFVALVDLPEGTEILFSDNGVNPDGSFRANEGVVKYTAGAAVAAGTVVTFDPDLLDAGDFSSVAGSLAFSTSGDQVIAYQEDAIGAVTFLHALHSNGADFDVAATSSNESALPPGLVAGTTAVAIPEADNVAYTGTTVGTKAELLAAIGNPANWVSNDDLPLAAAPAEFDVTPEVPASFAIAITEIWFGQDGTDLTGDWFEITNTGDAPWDPAKDGRLFYDDESSDTGVADPILGFAGLAPGETAIVVIGTAADAAVFAEVWGKAIDLTGVQIATTDGAGLGAGGDAVTLFVEDAGTGILTQIARETYPDGSSFSGRSYDVAASAFSEEGTGGAVATADTAGTSGTEPAIGSPGNGAAILPPASNFTLELFHFADQEGGIPALDDAPRFSAVLNALKAQDLGNDGIEDASLVLSSGDAIIPGVFFEASATVFGDAGRADILIQNELGVQAIALGNHEFDRGTADLAQLIAPNAAAGYSGALFPYLSANLDVTTDGDLAPLAVAGGAAPQAGTITSSVILEAGPTAERIGVIGVTTPTLGTISSPGGVSILPATFGGTPTAAELEALAAVIQAEVDALLAANNGLDKIVLLSHMQQLSIEQALIPLLSGVDIVVGGGSNTRLFDDTDMPRAGDSDQGQYPLFLTDRDGNTTALVNTDGNYKYVGRLVIDFDADGNVIRESYDETISGAYATDDDGVAALGAENLIDPEIQDIVDLLRAEILATEGNVFGVSDVFLNGTRGDVRQQETNLGNLTADANLAAARAADATVMVSIKNGGGIRDDIGQTIVPTGGFEPVKLPNEEVTDENGVVVKPTGGISETDIANSLRFNNGLTLLTLTREELVAVLEHAISGLAADDSASPGAFPQVSGIQFSFDASLAPGSRILSAAITDADGNDLDVLVSGGAIQGDPAAEVRIVTLNFLAGGGDGYPFPDLSEARVNAVQLTQDETAPRTGAATFAPDGSEQDALAEYLAANFATPATAFDQEDTGRDLDERIQNVAFRADTVIDGTVAPAEFTFAQSFEAEATGGQYTDTGDPAVDHDLVNNPGEAAVDSEVSGIALDGTLAFDATYENTRGDVGLSDGDFVGVTDFTGAVGSFTDGVQGYQISDPDGRMITTFETVDTSNAGEVEVTLDLFVADTGYEDDDLIEVRLLLEGAPDIVLFSATGDDLEGRGTWEALRAVVPASATAATLQFSVDTNASTEAAYVDNIRVTTDFAPVVEVPDPFALVLSELDREVLGGAEIVDFDPATDRAFVTSGDGVTVVDAANPAELSVIATLDPALSGATDSAVSSVSVKGGILAAAVPGADEQAPGQVFFYDTSTLAFLGAVTVGPLPDSIAFDETGSYLVVANEGESAGGDNEPDVLPNPLGSVSVIALNKADLALSTVTTLDFSDASLTTAALAAKGVRLNPNAPSVAADIEPEYVTILGKTAYVSLQENNAIAVIPDITNPGAFTIDSVIGLGTKDHSLAGNGLDASNRDGGINIANYPVNGLFMPDGIAAYEVAGKRYIVTANEGDGRGVDESRGAALVDGNLANGEVDAGIGEAIRAQLADPEALGRLIFSNVDGDTDGDGDIDVLHSFGARSFSIFDETGTLIFDSGEDFERLIERDFPEIFNSNGDASSFDERSDDKGPEPEAVVIGDVEGRAFAFIALERVGGIVVYDLTDPEDVRFVDYVRTEGDVAPEGLRFIAAADSPTGGPLLAVTSEGSGTLTFYDIGTEAIAFTKISEIQGAGDTSPLEGETVTIQAIVTADFQSNGFSMGNLGGFFVQEEEHDYDFSILTSEGLFIEDGAIPLVDVAVGDLVTITGIVSEQFGRTHLDAQIVTIEQSGVMLPDAIEVVFGPDLSPNLEAVEGMMTVIPEMVVTEMFNLDRFGEIRVADERPAQFTQNNAPDATGFAAHVAEVAARSIILDDGRSDQNPFEIRIPDGDDYRLTSADSFRMGDTLRDITGVMDFAFGQFRVQAPEAVYEATNPRPDSAPELGGNFKVASLNVLNFFTTLNDGTNVTSVGQGPRGANTAEELARQTDKIVKAITEIDADVLGLVEIENDISSAPLAALVDAVNAALGSQVYGFIDTGQVGDDAITNAIIYKLATAKPVGALDILDSEAFVDPLDSPAAGLNRPAVTQSFEHIQSGETLTVSVNHLKSKGSLSGLAVDEDQGDGQGNNNASRAKAAEVLADHLATNPTGIVTENVVILGDLNSYAQEDPIRLLADRGFTDVAYDRLGEDAYSYVFDGQTGTLDYILTSAGLADNIVGIAEWHINADEADAIDYEIEIRNGSGTATFATRDTSIFDGTTAARNSDHDPVVIAFQFDTDSFEFAQDDDYRVSEEALASEGTSLFRLGAVNERTTLLGNDTGAVEIVSVIANGMEFAADGTWFDGEGGGQFRVFAGGVFDFRNQGAAVEVGDTAQFAYKVVDAQGREDIATASVTVDAGPGPALDDDYTVASADLVAAGTGWFRLAAVADGSVVLANDDAVERISFVNGERIEEGVWFDGDAGGQFRVFSGGVVDFRNQGAPIAEGDVTGFQYGVLTAEGYDIATVSLSVSEFDFV